MSSKYYKKIPKGGVIIFEVFKGEVAKQKKVLHITNADIGKMTGYTKKTIDYFLTRGDNKDRDDSKNVAVAISKALNIEL